MRYLFQIAFKGTKYNGWQRQANSPSKISVQAKLEACLSIHCKEPIAIFGCGRTDAGVHAEKFFFHLDLLDKFEFSIFILNHMLAPDIIIHSISQIDDDLHARYSAKWRSYRYDLHFDLNPFLHEFSTYYPCADLDIKAMEHACKEIIEFTDFRYFCKTPDRNKNTLCTIKACVLHCDLDKNRISIYFTANRFLKSMIRILVQDLLDIGTGNLNLDEFRHIANHGRKYPLNKIAQPRGLFLIDVVY